MRPFSVAIWPDTNSKLPLRTHGTYAHHPLVQHQLASMYLELDSARATVECLAHDWVDGVDHGERWPIQVLSAKWRAATASMRVVELA